MKSSSSRTAVPSAGFSIVEMLAVITLLGIFLLLAGMLFNDAMRASRQAHDAVEQHQTLTALFRFLREDIRQARRISITGDHQLNLTLPDDRNVTWTLTPQGVVTRDLATPAADAARTRSWHTGQSGLSWRWRAMCVVMSVEQLGRPREASFPASWMLAMRSDESAGVGKASEEPQRRDP